MLIQDEFPRRKGITVLRCLSVNLTESPFALTEEAAHGVGHFLFHTKLGMALVNAGVLVGVGILAYTGAKALWQKMFQTRSSVRSVLQGA